jgi:hypothetical protein
MISREVNAPARTNPVSVSVLRAPQTAKMAMAGITGRMLAICIVSAHCTIGQKQEQKQMQGVLKQPKWCLFIVSTGSSPSEKGRRSGLALKQHKTISRAMTTQVTHRSIKVRTSHQYSSAMSFKVRSLR